MSADSSKGKMRTYLLTAVQNFSHSEHAKATAQKRGGDQPTISIDQALAEERYSFEPSHEITPDRMFDRRWAIALLQRALGRLEEHYRDLGKTDVFDTLQPFLERGPEAGSYAAATRQLGMSETGFKQTVFRFRKLYQTKLRDEVRLTVGGEEDVDRELGQLLDALR